MRNKIIPSPSVLYVSEWRDPIMQASASHRFTYKHAQWNVSVCSGGSTATARNADKTQIFVGGAGADTFTGGELFDVIVGSDDKQWCYLLTSGGDLIISKVSSPDSITIRNWQSNGGNKLGIILDDTPVTNPPAIHTYNGDQRPKIIGVEIDLDVPGEASRFDTYNWSATNWAADGTLNGGVVKADFDDVIKGSAGNGKINGLGGNDALDGSAGNDYMDSEEGSGFNMAFEHLPANHRRYLCAA